MRIFVSLLVLVTLSACSFSVPTEEEQMKLVQDPNFPGGAPPWFSNAAGGNASLGNGIIPQTVTPVASLAARTAEVQYPLLVRSEDLAKAAETPAVAKATSSLDRIANQCSGTEDAVNAALTNTNREAKIKQYEALTKKCPMSADLQLWLSQEYLKANKLIQARTGFEQVLVLDPTNEEAKAGIAKTEQALRQQ
jgi:hypothetical protein